MNATEAAQTQRIEVTRTRSGNGQVGRWVRSGTLLAAFPMSNGMTGIRFTCDRTGRDIYMAVDEWTSVRYLEDSCQFCELPASHVVRGYRKSGFGISTLHACGWCIDKAVDFLSGPDDPCHSIYSMQYRYAERSA